MTTLPKISQNLKKRYDKNLPKTVLLFGIVSVLVVLIGVFYLTRVKQKTIEDSVDQRGQKIHKVTCTQGSPFIGQLVRFNCSQNLRIEETEEGFLIRVDYWDDEGVQKPAVTLVIYDGASYMSIDQIFDEIRANGRVSTESAKLGCNDGCAPIEGLYNLTKNTNGKLPFISYSHEWTTGNETFYLALLKPATSNKTNGVKVDLFSSRQGSPSEIINTILSSLELK